MHECPECCDPCSCVAGGIDDRNCSHCDDLLDEDEDDFDEEDAY